MQNLKKKIKATATIQRFCGHFSHKKIVWLVSEKHLICFSCKKIKNVFANFFWGGWEVVTGALVKQINRKCEGIVFMLWGNKAILKNQHLVNIFSIEITISLGHNYWSEIFGFGIVFMLWGNKAILKNQHLVNIFESK